MKFLVNVVALREQLTLINSVIPKNPTIPVLENFLFEIKEGRLKVTASDLQITSVTSTDIESKEEGKMAIPASIFLETLRKLPEEIITISLDTESYMIEVQSSKGRYKLSSENPEDFPISQRPEKSFSIELEKSTLQEALQSTTYAISNDELRPAMTGLFVKISSKEIVFVGTDGHRLTTFTHMFTKEQEDVTHTMILPFKVVNMLKALLAKSSSESVHIEFNPTQALFLFEHVELSCRLIDERFPDYEKVIPNSNNNHITISREEMLSSLERVAIYANKSTQQMRFKVSGEQLSLIVEDLDFSNEAKETFSCTHTGEDIEIGFNVRFMIDIFQHMSSEKLCVQVEDPEKAALVLPVEESQETKHLALIMPIMLDN